MALISPIPNTHLPTVVYGVNAAAHSTIVCDSCVPASSTPDVVTRSDEPAVPCTAPPLSMVTSAGYGGNSTNPGPEPSDVQAAGSKIVGGVGGVAAIVVMAVNVL